MARLIPRSHCPFHDQPLAYSPATISTACLSLPPRSAAKTSRWRAACSKSIPACAVRQAMRSRVEAMTLSPFIGIDWGSTHLRAFRYANDGAVLETRRASQGAAGRPRDQYEPALRDVLGDWLD